MNSIAARPDKGIDLADMPDHIVETVSELADLHAAHKDAVGTAEQAIRVGTSMVGRPMFLALFLTIVGLWIFANIFASAHGHKIDEPPFVYLDLVCTLIGVSLTVLILITQQRDDALAERREQLTLELVVIGDRKSAKIIELLEELRRDLPSVVDRMDREAQQMALPDDPTTVLEAIRSSHGGPENGLDEPPLGA